MYGHGRVVQSPNVCSCQLTGNSRNNLTEGVAKISILLLYFATPLSIPACRPGNCSLLPDNKDKPHHKKISTAMGIASRSVGNKTVPPKIGASQRNLNQHLVTKSLPATSICPPERLLSNLWKHKPLKQTTKQT